jgi:hypothetical protein
MPARGKRNIGEIKKRPNGASWLTGAPPAAREWPEQSSGSVWASWFLFYPRSIVSAVGPEGISRIPQFCDYFSVSRHSSRFPESKYQHWNGRSNMRREDLMKPDVLSEIVLIASGVALFIPLLLMLIMSLTHVPVP